MGRTEPIGRDSWTYTLGFGGDFPVKIKMTEYTDFCDLFYIAIPAGDDELKKAVQAVMLPEWGLIEVSEGEENVYNYVAEVTIPAKKNQGVLRDRTLSTALIRFSML